MFSGFKKKLTRSNTPASPLPTGPATGAGPSSMSTPISPPASSSPSTSAVGGAGASSISHGMSNPSGLPSTSSAAAAAEHVPQADVSLPHQALKKERRRSSIPGGAGSAGSGGGSAAAGSSAEAGVGGFPYAATFAAAGNNGGVGILGPGMADLGSLKDVATQSRREHLFKQKLQLCCVTAFNWDDGLEGVDKRAKEIKRLTLLELVDYINTPSGQKILTEALYTDVVNMVGANIFRSLPPSLTGSGSGEEVTGAGGGEGGEDDEPFLEPAWPHLQLVYEFALRFVISNEVKVKAAKKQIDTVFCAKLVELFDSEDPRERDYLKTILHRIYGKFLSHRSFIRKAISHVFFRFVYETEKHNGIGELLEILGSIINGFALPLKDEHVQFLERALVPLHRPRCIANYFQQLSFCMVQYIEKDPNTINNIIRGLIKCWPHSSSSKQVLLLNELEELLEVAGPEAIDKEKGFIPLFNLLSRCLGSPHFQVAERALFLWNNEALMQTGILSKAHAASALPILYTSLQRQAAGHWNPTVETLARNVLKHYEDADPAGYEKAIASAAAATERKASKTVLFQQHWREYEDACRKAYPQGKLPGGAGSFSNGSWSPLLSPVGNSVNGTANGGSDGKAGEATDRKDGR